MEMNYDAIVIGTGMSGGWAAKELCEKGLKTLVLERGRMIKHIEDYKTANKEDWEFPAGDVITQEIEKRQPKQSRTGYVNTESTKKGEKSWLFKMVQETPIETSTVEENTETNPINAEQETTPQTINDNNETTNTEELPELAEDDAVTLTPRMKQYNNMMKILQNFSNFDAEGFEYSDWKYKKNDFKVLVNFNMIIYNNEIVGMRFYDKEQGGYYPIFINEDDF